VLSITAPSTLPTSACNLAAQLSFGNPALFGRCGLSPTTPTHLTVYVDQYCGVELYPVQDSACAEPAQSYWSSMKIKGFYVTPGRIATTLGSATRCVLQA